MVLVSVEELLDGTVYKGGRMKIGSQDPSTRFGGKEVDAAGSSSVFCADESRFSSTRLEVFRHKTRIELLVCGSSVK